MYSTFSNPCWTIDVCMVNSGRLQQANSRSTVIPAGTDGLYSAWQRKNTWVLGTHGARRSGLWVIHPPKHQETGTKYGGWSKKKKRLLLLSLVLLCPFGLFCCMVLFCLLPFLFALHLSEDCVDGEFGGQGVVPGSWFLFPFSPTPSIFTPVSKHMAEREREKCDRWSRHALVLVQKDYKGGKAAWPSEGSSLAWCDPIYAHTVHPD